MTTSYNRFDVWTYASANSVTTPGDLSNTYWPGQKVVIVQGTAKFFQIVSVVYSSPNTTITLNGFGTYTLTSAAITYHADTTFEYPKGFPLIGDQLAVHSSSSKTTPSDSDEIEILDSDGSYNVRKLTWSNLKTTLASYLDTLYANIIHSHEYFSGYDVIVYQSGGNTIAENGWTHELIDSGTTGPTVNTRVLNAAYDACPTNGSLYIGLGTYYVYASTVCTAGPAGYLTYHVALPVSKNIHIRGAGMGATVLMLAAGQHYTDHPALIMYVFHPYADGGFGTAYTAFSLEDLTFDGNVSGQTVWHYDGAGLFLNGSTRKNGVFRNLEFRNSADSGFYSGNNGGGWEVDGIFDNIYSHDNAEFDQIDNPQNCVLTNWICDNNGYAYNHIGLVIDTWSGGERSLIATNINIRNSMLFIFGPDASDPNVLSDILINNLFIECTDQDCNALYVKDITNVRINGGKIKANTDTNYAVSLYHVTNIEIDNVEMVGLRGVVSTISTVNSATLRNCDIETTGHCMVPRVGDVYNFYGCSLITTGTETPTWLIEAISGVTVGLFNCTGDGGEGIISGGGTINHSGTFNLGLEAFGYDSVADGGSISHGLKITPNFVTITPSEEGTIATPAGIGAVTFDVNFSGVTTTQTVYWHARY